MKKVLIITYYWPPSGGSGVQRWLKFAKYLPSFGWKPIIYTPENPEFNFVDESLLKDIPTDIEVLKRPIIEPYSLYRKLFGKNSIVDMKQLTSSEKERGTKRSIKDKISLYIRSNFFVPDPRILWKRTSVCFLKKYLKENPVDMIITTGPPQSMHLIGLELSKLGYPWVPDFRDPWTQMYWFKKQPFISFIRKKHFSLEKKVIDKASAVLTVTPFVKKEYEKKTNTPIYMITNGFDEEDFEFTVERDDYFNLVHTGLFPVDGNPILLWEVLSDMLKKDSSFSEKLKIKLIGDTDIAVLRSFDHYGLGKYVVNMGYLPHLEAITEQKKANCLLLPLRNDSEYRLILPGKVFEYMAAQQVILGFGQEDGAMADLLTQTQAGIVCDWTNKEKIQNFMEKQWIDFKNGKQYTENKLVNQYSRRALTHKLVEMFEEIINK